MSKLKQYILSESFYRAIFNWRKTDFSNEENLVNYIYIHWIKKSAPEMEKLNKWANTEIVLVP